MAMLLVLAMIKKVVRCSVCIKVHDIADLLNLKQALNGNSTFICPVKKTAGSYRLENVGTLNIQPPAVSAPIV